MTHRSRTPRRLPVLLLGAATMALAPTVAAALPTTDAAWPRAESVQKGKGNRGKGPAFCRSGAGHPVYGRQWCLQKGFGLGRVAWHQVSIGDIVLGRVPRGRIAERRIDARDVAEILTDAVLDEIFDRSGRRLDRERLAGRWRGGEEDGILVLELSLGEDPVAELTDHDLDGRIDVVIVPERRR